MQHSLPGFCSCWHPSITNVVLIFTMAFEAFSWLCASHDRASIPVSMVYNQRRLNPLPLKNSIHYSSLKNKKVLKTREPTKVQNAPTLFYPNQNAWSKNKHGKSSFNPNLRPFWCFSNCLFITIFQVFPGSIHSNSHTVCNHALCNSFVSLGMGWALFLSWRFWKAEIWAIFNYKKAKTMQ